MYYLIVSASFQEMLDIMKAIYDMMGKCTYPVLKEDAPRQHVETFFQVGTKAEVRERVQLRAHVLMSIKYYND